MAQKSRNVLKGYLETGDKPTQAEFIDLVDSIPNFTTDSFSSGDETLNNTHRASNGTDHANVVLNDTHRASDGTNHANVGLNDTHRSSDGTDHANVDKYVKVEVSSAEILDINSTPKQLVAAPGAGKVLAPVFSINKHIFNTAPYATNTDLAIIHNGETAKLIDMQGLINSGVDRILQAPASALKVMVSNKALELTELSGNPANGSGTLTIYLWYKIITL